MIFLKLLLEGSTLDELELLDELLEELEALLELEDGIEEAELNELLEELLELLDELDEELLELLDELDEDELLLDEPELLKEFEEELLLDDLLLEELELLDGLIDELSDELVGVELDTSLEDSEEGKGGTLLLSLVDDSTLLLDLEVKNEQPEMVKEAINKAPSMILFFIS